MKLNFYLLLLLPLLSFASPTFTAAIPDHPLTLTELVEIALENTPSTKQTWWNAQRAASSLGIAKSSYYPQIGVDADVTHGRTFKYINGPDTTFTTLGVDLYLNMLLYDYGARPATVDAAKKALIAAGWQTDAAIQKVLVNVLENAYATLYANDVTLASTISLEEAEKVLNAAKELNRTGLTPISDVFTAQSNYYQAKMALAKHKAEYDIHKGKLATSLGLNAETSIELAPIEAITLPSKESLETLIEIAFSQRADLMAMQARTAESFAKKQVAKASYGPKVSLYAAGGANHSIGDKADDGQYVIAVNLDMPLFTGFRISYENRIAYADTQLAMNELADLQLNISLEVLTASRTMQAAQEMLPDAEENLKFALKAYESVLTKYKAGKERIADLSYAQQELAQARVFYSDIKTRWLVSVANLAYATGSLAPYMESSCNVNH